MKRLALICLTILCCCREKALHEQSADSTSVAIKKDSVVAHPEALPNSESNFEGANLDFEKLDTAIQRVLNNFHEADLNSIINPKYGCYWIKAGAGVYPIVTEIKASSDLSECQEFIFFVREPMALNGYFDNPKGVDNCNPPEGIFLFDIEDRQVVFSAYQSQLSATDDKVPSDKAQKLMSLDGAISKHIVLMEQNKFAQPNSFEFYLAKIDGKYYLAAIDTRGCGI